MMSGFVCVDLVALHLHYEVKFCVHILGTASALLISWFLKFHFCFLVWVSENERRSIVKSVAANDCCMCLT